MIGLVWNGMLSFGGGWFFLAASEAISVGNKTYTLPGIGSYVAAAVDKGDIGEVGIAIAVMVILVVGVNFVFWRRWWLTPRISGWRRRRRPSSPKATC